MPRGDSQAMRAARRLNLPVVRRMRIRSKLVLLLLLVGVVPMAVVGLVTYRGASSTLRDEAGRAMPPRR